MILLNIIDLILVGIYYAIIAALVFIPTIYAYEKITDWVVKTYRSFNAWFVDTFPRIVYWYHLIGDLVYAVTMRVLAGFCLLMVVVFIKVVVEGGL